MDPTEMRAEWLAGLASHLSSSRTVILKNWRRFVDDDPDLTTPTSLPRALFNDHIPHVLEAFSRRLRAGLRRETSAAAAKFAENAEAHGLQRWQQGYRLREVTGEWGHLQRCLLDELNNYAAAHRAVDPAVLHAAYQGLVALCSEGVIDSTAQYFHLEQIEAMGQVRDLSQALDQLREFERERAELWREAAHDLRGNFGVVANATAGLSLQAVPESMREKLFSLLQKSVSSVHGMLDDVMSLARLQAGQELRRVATFDAAALLREMCEGFQGMAHDGRLWLDAKGPDQLVVTGDPVKVRRIAQNLILNALKYTREGGVTVSWSSGGADDRERWMLSIRDSGPGIHTGPAAPIAEALEVATHESVTATTKEDTKEEQSGSLAKPMNAPSGTAKGDPPDPGPAVQVRGEGIGLSIVKRLCDLLDASVEVESKAGEGTVFRVLLPRSYPAREAPAP